ncbi:MAG: hypothetical protein ACK4KV_14135 [Rhodocyclaceae bacterium]
MYSRSNEIENIALRARVLRARYIRQLTRQLTRGLRRSAIALFDRATESASGAPRPAPAVERHLLQAFSKPWMVSR